MHKKLALDEQIGIEAFLNRKGWGNMERTGSGLYIFPRPTANSHSIPIKYGDTVVFSAKIFLLNGTKIFDGIQTVIIGKTEIIQGLREALGRVRYGENAFLVVPSHLAFGFSGDGDAVPPYATLIYELNIRNKN
ncbi:MAG: FKBP-type peptidyl-prolyl cis-trans isomerase [Bacteroidales bacterium]|nr:FKBP-type peptidyl-prolyl cis-trans isomerase [Bacteroidales bacterium]